MQKLIRLWFLLIFLFGFGHQALAADNPVVKLGRGLENIVTSPLEYLLHYDRLNKQEKSWFATTFAGTVYGTFWAVYRILGGGVEAVTFLIPLPPYDAPLLNPSTPIESLKAHGYFD